MAADCVRYEATVARKRIVMSTPTAAPKVRIKGSP
jgi:hypothetical protein